MSADHPADPRAHAACAALRTLARILAADLPAPPEGTRYTGTATDADAHWQAVVILTRWDGPPRLHLAPGVELPRKLGPTERRILELCRRDAAISGRTLARRIAKPYSSYFRGLLTRLVTEGRLKRAAQGYLLA